MNPILLQKLTLQKLTPRSPSAQFCKVWKNQSMI